MNVMPGLQTGMFAERYAFRHKQPSRSIINGKPAIRKGLSFYPEAVVIRQEKDDLN